MGGEAIDQSVRFHHLIVRLFEVAQDLEDAIRRCPELADDLAVVWILLAFERSPCLVDIAKTLCDLLSIGIADTKDAVP